MHAPPHRALVVVVALSAASLAACKQAPPPPPPTAVEAPASQPKPVDAARVLAILNEGGSSVAVSLQQRGPDVGLVLRGEVEPALALVLLASLPKRLPEVRVSRLMLDARSWTATASILSVPASEPPLLADIVDAVRHVFTGEGALLASGVVEPTATGIVFRGVPRPGRGLMEAAAAVPPGFSLAKVEAGPTFVFEITRAP